MSERDLWIAVINQALKDALSDPAKARTVTNAKASWREAREARDWFIHARRDFMRACCNAGLDPNFVRDGAMRQMRASGLLPAPEFVHEEETQSGTMGTKEQNISFDDPAARSRIAA